MCLIFKYDLLLFFKFHLFAKCIFNPRNRMRALILIVPGSNDATMQVRSVDVSLVCAPTIFPIDYRRLKLERSCESRQNWLHVDRTRALGIFRSKIAAFYWRAIFKVSSFWGYLVCFKFRFTDWTVRGLKIFVDLLVEIKFQTNGGERVA